MLAVACDEPVGILTPDGRRRRGEVREVEALLLEDQDGQRLAMREGTKGPRLFDWAAVPILHPWEDDGRHWLLIRRSISDPQEKRYSFVFAPKGTSLAEMVQAIGARWHLEEDCANAKDMGLDHDEVRSFSGWYRHITLVLTSSCLPGSHVCNRLWLPFSSRDLRVSCCCSASPAIPDHSRGAPSACPADLARCARPRAWY